MTAGALVAFWAVSFLLVMTPGADWAYAIEAGIRHRSVLPSVGGLVAGHAIATVVVATGVGAVVARSGSALTALTVAGAGYVVWLGVGSVRHPSSPSTAATTAAGSGWRQALRGAGTSGLNPKVVLLFLALLPQFTDPDARWPIAAQILALGLVHVASCAVIYTLVGVRAKVVLGTRPTVARTVSRVSGAAMIVIGLALVFERLAA